MSRGRGNQQSPDPLDCIAEDVDREPRRGQHDDGITAQRELAKERTARASMSTLPRSPNAVENGRPAKKPRLRERDQEDSTGSNRHDQVGSSSLPVRSSASPVGPIIRDEMNVSGSDRLTPPKTINTELPTALPPIISAGVTPSGASARAEIEAESSVLPSAHDLAEALSERGASSGADGALTFAEVRSDVKSVAERSEEVGLSDVLDGTLAHDKVSREDGHIPSARSSILEPYIDEDQEAEAGGLASEVPDDFERRETLSEPDDFATEITAEVFPGQDASSSSFGVEANAVPPAGDADHQMGEEEGEEEIEADEPVETVQNESGYYGQIAATLSPGRESSASTSTKKASKSGKSDKGKSASGKKPASSKKSKGKGKTKVDDLKASASVASPSVSSKARSESVPASVSIGSEIVAAGDEPEPELYCLCRKVFDEEDEEGVMVGCDGCEGWFHPSCIKIKEEDVQMLDLYICPNCEETTTQRTTWKRTCKREGCNHSVTSRPSKYCSSTCAFQHMASQIPPQASNKLLKQLSTAFIGLPRPKPQTSITTHSAIRSTRTSRSDPITLLQKQLDEVNKSIELVQKRQRILEQVMAACEALPPLEVNAAAPSKASKKKGGQRSTAEDRPCGWTERLIWDDEGVMQWDGETGGGENEGFEQCTNPRRRCDRHQGWQKTAPVLLEAELVHLERQKERIDAELARKTTVVREEEENEPREVMRRYLRGRVVSTS